MKTSKDIIVLVYRDGSDWKFRKDGMPAETIMISHAAAAVTFCMDNNDYCFKDLGADWRVSNVPWIAAPELSSAGGSLMVAIVNNYPSTQPIAQLQLSITDNETQTKEESAIITVTLGSSNTDEFAGVAGILRDQIHVDISLHTEQGCTFSGDMTGDSIYVQSLAAEVIFNIVQAPPGWTFVPSNSSSSPIHWGTDGLSEQPLNISQVLDATDFSFRLLIINNNNDNPSGNRYPFDLYFTQGMIEGSDPDLMGNTALHRVTIKSIRNVSLRSLQRGVDPTIINQQPDPTGGANTAATTPQPSLKATIAA